MDSIKYLMVMWIVAVIFIVIGIYVMSRGKPMWLWAGSKISESEINDVKGYNQAVGKMWCVFSIPLFIGGIVEFLLPVYSIIIFAFATVINIGLSVWIYHKIEENIVQVKMNRGLTVYIRWFHRGYGCIRHI